MPVRLNSPGGGSVTLDVPATGTTTTLNLPIGGGTLVGTGAITSSGLTMNTARLLGRTTASSGAVEEITVGSGLTLTGGTLATSGGSQLQEQLFTSSGSWTAPTGVTRVQAIVIGGGAGGGGSVTGCAPDGGEGGNGGIAVGLFTVTPGTSYTITVGLGGNAGTSTGNGSAGGTSSFGALASATGGGGGVSGNNGGGNGAAGSGANGTIRNSNIGVVSPANFNGSSVRIAANGGAAAVTWSISSTFSPGARGQGGRPGWANGMGGISGIVYLQWVG